jgi:hypothetical protein
MEPTQTQSVASNLVELAARNHRFWFITYVIWVVIAAIASAFLTWMLWRAGNQQQDALVAESNERTANLKHETTTLSISLAEVETKRAEAERKLLEVEKKIAPREITEEQKRTFLAIIQGHPTGKVIVSAFFDDKEGHGFAKQITDLIKEAGFEVIEDRTLNFFAQGGGDNVQLGIVNLTRTPVHAISLQIGFGAIGINAGLTGTINTKAEDVVEIQVRKKPTLP